MAPITQRMPRGSEVLVSATDLFTIEQSHDADRLTAPRPSKLGTAATVAERSSDHTPAGTFGLANKASAERGAKRALRGAYAAARERINAAVASGADLANLPEADRLLADAFQVHMAGMRELGSRSVFVQGQSLVHAIEAVLHAYFMNAAASAGFLSDRGAELKAMADGCAATSAKALTACLAASKFLGTRRKRKRGAPAYFEAEGVEAGK
jgi:hypothetical protein